jgi:hypothetical protein
MTTPETKLRELLAKATPGEWSVHENPPRGGEETWPTFEVDGPSGVVCRIGLTDEDDEMRANAAMIAEMKNALLSMLGATTERDAVRDVAHSLGRQDGWEPNGAGPVAYIHWLRSENAALRAALVEAETFVVTNYRAYVGGDGTYHCAGCAVREADHYGHVDGCIYTRILARRCVEG